MCDEIVTKVSQAIKNAKANGYDVEATSAFDLANDLRQFDADLEGHALGSVYLAVLHCRHGYVSPA